MSELHQALETLGPIDFSEVPVDGLEPFLRHHFKAGELITNSVPPPPGGEPFESSTPQHTTPDSAATSKDIVSSPARPPTPDKLHADLRKQWGKPMKLSAKDNPLGISVYKMAGHDRHGAWFARRSVHEGLSFSKFRKAMQREFAESLAVQGGPGEGNVRGIGGDRRLEKKKLDGVGQMEVYQLSAQFPGPTTPREFVTLLLTSDSALTEKSAKNGNSGEVVPRHYMVISRPVKHPEAPERQGFIRGQYESVELIREIPINPASKGKSASTSNLLESHDGKAKDDARGRSRGSTIGFAESRGPGAKGENVDRGDGSAGDPELNPVEWIMITRSDPGGGIPRFMVERGTPGSIVADAVKFLDWATGKGEIPEPDEDEELQAKASESKAEAPPPTQMNGDATAETPAQRQQEAQLQGGQTEGGGVISHLTNALEAGLDAYAPTTVSSYAHQYLDQQDVQQPSTRSYDDDSSSSSSSESFASAEDFRPTNEGPPASMPRESTDSLASLDSKLSSGGAQPTNHHEREFLKLEKDRERLEQKLAKKRQAEDEKLRSQQEKDKKDVSKAEDKHEREIRKQQEKHDKEMRKIEQKKEKELRKAEEKRRKALDKDILNKVTRERDEYRDRCEVGEKERTLLREQVGELQRENTILVQRIAKLGGENMVRELKAEAGRPRASSKGSVKSARS